MKSAKKGRKERVGPKQKSKPEKGKPAETPEDLEKPHDFGGLPERNLKKNLGC